MPPRKIDPNEITSFNLHLLNLPVPNVDEESLVDVNNVNIENNEVDVQNSDDDVNDDSEEESDEEEDSDDNEEDDEEVYIGFSDEDNQWDDVMDVDEDIGLSDCPVDEYGEPLNEYARCDGCRRFGLRDTFCLYCYFGEYRYDRDPYDY